jgi:hypothetical protein
MVALVTCVLGGCEPSERPQGAAAPASSVSETPRPLPGGPRDVMAAEERWGEFASKRFGLRLPLPDGPAWRIDDHTGRFLLATNASTGSELAVRLWREDEVVNRQRCEAKARVLRALPERASAELVDRRAVSVPAAFDTVVETFVVPVKAQGGVITAFALAFGGLERRCFAYVFETRAAFAGAAQIVGDRLGSMVQGSLEKLVFSGELEQRVERPKAFDASGAPTR